MKLHLFEMVYAPMERFLIRQTPEYRRILLLLQSILFLVLLGFMFTA